MLVARLVDVHKRVSTHINSVGRLNKDVAIQIDFRIRVCGHADGVGLDRDVFSVEINGCMLSRNVQGFRIILSPDTSTSGFNHNVLGIQFQCRRTCCLLLQYHEAVTAFSINKLGFVTADHGTAVAHHASHFCVSAGVSFESDFLSMNGEIRISKECVSCV